MQLRAQYYPLVAFWGKKKLEDGYIFFCCHNKWKYYSFVVDKILFQKLKQI